MLKRIFSIVIIMVMFANSTFANEFVIENDRGDTDFSINFNGKSKIFELEISNESNGKIIEGEFSIADIVGNHVILYYNVPLYLEGNIVRQLNVGDEILINMYKNEKDVRLNIYKDFFVCERIKYMKSHNDIAIFSKKNIKYSNVEMFKLKEKDSEVEYYVPIVDEKYIEVIYDDSIIKNNIGIKYNLKLSENVKVYKHYTRSVYNEEKRWWENVDEYKEDNIDLKELRTKFAKIYKVIFDSEDNVVGLCYKDIVIGGIYG